MLGKVQGVTGHLSMNAVAEATPTAIRRLGEESLDLFFIFQGSNPKGERERERAVLSSKSYWF